MNQHMKFWSSKEGSGKPAQICRLHRTFDAPNTQNMDVDEDGPKS